jgi:hypothetical protein
MTPSPLQRRSVPVQASAHAPPHAPLLQASPLAHATGTSQSVHASESPCPHACTASPAQRRSPAAHSSVHVSEQAPRLHERGAQGEGSLQPTHPLDCRSQTTTASPRHSTLPSRQSASSQVSEPEQEAQRASIAIRSASRMPATIRLPIATREGGRCRRLDAILTRTYVAGMSRRETEPI